MKKYIYTFLFSLLFIANVVSAAQTATITNGGTTLTINDTTNGGYFYLYTCNVDTPSALCPYTFIGATPTVITAPVAGHYTYYSGGATAPETYITLSANAVGYGYGIYPVYSNGTIFSFSPFPPPPPPIALPSIPLSDLTAAFGSTYNSIVPVTDPYVFLFIGTVIAMVVTGFAVGFFKKEKRKSSLGYFTGGGTSGTPFHRMEDQELGAMEYQIQTTGKWIK
jgi:hypothetical protein